MTSNTKNIKHHCHWPGCHKIVPPSLWGCATHWFKLPVKLRQRIWHHYVPGQEINKNPTPAYIEVAKDVQDWIKANNP
jgi:hypothetical protein